MPRIALKPSPNLARLLRDRRERLALSAHEVSRRTAAVGERIPVPTLLKIEDAKQEPGVRRLYSLLRLYDIPVELVPDLLELESLVVEPPAETDPEALMRRGIECWKRGEIGEALACVFAVRAFVDVVEGARLARQRALITFSIMARYAGKTGLAKRLVDEVLAEGPDAEVLPDALLQASMVWEDLGAIEASLAFVERAAKHIEQRDKRRWGLVLSQRARCFGAGGRAAEALALLDEAQRCFKDCDDHDHQAKCLITRSRLQTAQGDVVAAERSAKAAGEIAAAHGLRPAEAEARLASADAFRAAGDGAKTLAELQQALALAVAIDDRELLFRVHYRLWKLFERTGDAERARLSRDAAAYFVKSVDKPSPEAAETRALDSPGASPDSPTRARRRRGTRST